MNTFDWRKPVGIDLFILKIVGLWPEEYEGYKPNLYLLYASLSTCMILGGHNLSQIINIFYVYTDLEALTGTIFIAATNTFSVVKRYFFVKNIKTIKRLFQTLNTDQFRPKNRDQEKLVELSIRNWKRAYICFNMVVGTWLLIPVLNFLTKVHGLPFDAWYPFDATASPNYELAYVYQLICIFYIALSNLNVDTLIYAFMMFIGCQCDILTDNVKNLSVQNYGQELLSCINHHKKILSFAEDANRIFNVIIFGQIATSTAALALSMFQLSLVDVTSVLVWAHLLYVFGMLSEIFYYCWFGNEVQVKSGQIPYAVYESKWIGQSRDIIKNLIILCERCQRPIKITAMNLFTFSLETFIAILRTAWSYYAVLSAVDSNKSK